MTKPIRLLLLTPAFVMGACVANAPSGAPSTDPTVPLDPSGPSIAYLDTDGDGVIDAIDTDGDGKPNYWIDETRCKDGCVDPQPVASCTQNPLIDEDGDGSFDGIDWDCDGTIDGYFGLPPDDGSGSGSGSSGGGSTIGECVTIVSVNNVQYTIDCTSSGGAYTCKCSVNNTLVQTCTTSSSSACSYPNGSCCTF